MWHTAPIVDLDVCDPTMVSGNGLTSDCSDTGNADPFVNCCALKLVFLIQECSTDYDLQDYKAFLVTVDSVCHPSMAISEKMILLLQARDQTVRTERQWNTCSLSVAG
ncbi:predicted protein [Arabidopsis lyrata subsp. lyrata]|uniref:Predicted protein n=1 Tax=Arabidopsis lyrata subsp. lyrata TaxID=81972 RepID=D7LZH0_ARALL|nr:predicted protein [Arabidopsis lyrata subsp. lyrata]